MGSDMGDEKLISLLRDAVDGLYYMSETDSPFEILQWRGQPAPTANSVLQLVGKPEDSPVEVRSLEVFFERLIREQEWHSDQERAIAQRFRTLLELIQQHLSDTQVYRVGEIEIDIYIVGQVVGQAQSGDWIALHTQAVET